MPRRGVLVALAALVCHGAAFAPPQLAPALYRRTAASGVSAAAKKKQPAVAFKGFGVVPPKLENRVPGDAPLGSDRTRTAARCSRCTTAARRLTASAGHTRCAYPRVRRRAVRVPVGARVRAVLQALPRGRKVAGDPAPAHAQQVCSRAHALFPACPLPPRLARGLGTSRRAELPCVGRWPAGTPAMPIGYQTGSSTRHTGCALHRQLPCTPARCEKCHRAPCIRTRRSF